MEDFLLTGGGKSWTVQSKDTHTHRAKIQPTLSKLDSRTSRDLFKFTQNLLFSLPTSSDFCLEESNRVKHDLGQQAGLKLVRYSHFRVNKAQ